MRFPFLVSCLLAAALPSSAAAQQPVDIRVAIVAYEDFRQEFANFESCFFRLQQQEPGIHFEIAVGSYNEVQYWMERQWVDLAILTPGVFAAIAPEAGENGTEGYQYLTSMLIPEVSSSETSQPIRNDRFRHTYQPICLVPENSTLRTIDDLLRAIANDQIDLLMVHPLSVSGCVAPLAALAELGSKPKQSQLQFTQSHSQTIRNLNHGGASDASRLKAGFVWDDAAGWEPASQALVRRLAFPALEAIDIPHDVVVARRGFSHADQVRDLLHGYEDAAFRFAELQDWGASFAKVRQWQSQSKEWTASLGTDSVTLDNIVQMLLLYARAQPEPPRLALVLSGGGAKCSYQVGVVSALEEKLAEARANNPDHPLDIGLVVGTSGGAINSVPIAMGITASSEGRNLFRKTWQSLDQRDIVRPSKWVRVNMGLWFASLQVAIVYLIVRWLTPPEILGRRVVMTLFGVALVELALGYFRIPWGWLGTNHVVHHVWLWLSLGIDLAAWSLLLVCISAFFFRGIGGPLGTQQPNTPSALRFIFAAAIFGLPLLQCLSLLFFEKTLSGEQGMESSIAKKIPKLINEHLFQQNQSPLRVAHGSQADMLKAASQQILERGLLQRDLVITGSCLDQTSDALPSDLYFFTPAATHGALTPHYGERGIALTEYPDILLDVVMGSGSIYPIFPSRKIAGIPTENASILLVDGGYAHNSPVEAAVLWGATHVILVEATPRTPSRRGSFAVNVASSFHHLHQQAQLLDVRSRSKVSVFSIAPEPPHICVLDFAENLIAASIDDGYRDATQQVATRSRIRREIGEPVFLSVENRKN